MSDIFQILSPGLPGKILHILLADDDTDDCLLFKEAMGELLFQGSIKFVHDGEDLMKMLQKKEDVPDIFFLDLNMPKKNGFACLDEIKLAEDLTRLPVIVFSTSYETNIVNRLFKTGALYYMRKPNEFSQLKELISRALVLTEEYLNTPYSNSENPFAVTRENFVIAHSPIL